MTDRFDSQFFVPIEMSVTTIRFLPIHLGPWNDLNINNKAVPVEVEMHKRAILVQFTLS